MNIDRTINHDATKLARLIAVVAWYDQAPNEDFGDRFHNDVADVIDELMPSIPELIVPYPTHYYTCPEMVDGRLVVKLISDTDGMDDLLVEIVPVDV